MTEAQKTATVIVRLLALFLVLRGVVGLAGFAALQRVVGEVGTTTMAIGAALALLGAGGVLFLGAPVLARLVTFDLK
ncbi:MAG: hypothetical protein JSU98_12005 [Gemmatimonadales bacterium]|jgi:hypothetical protein|nr:MAG: hypothetical protein JSU98_12005 [Gemmatimonadales bacterium]